MMLYRRILHDGTFTEDMLVSQTAKIVIPLLSD
jgi:hypothetical protein